MISMREHDDSLDSEAFAIFQPQSHILILPSQDLEVVEDILRILFLVSVKG